MKIESGIFYDFKDVLIKPKRSDLSSRSEVDLTKKVKFLHSKREWEGIPIIISNMDTTGTFEMYRVLHLHKIITVLHKHYEEEDYPLDLDPNFYSLSTGISDNDLQNVKDMATSDAQPVLYFLSLALIGSGFLMALIGLFTLFSVSKEHLCLISLVRINFTTY